MSLLKNRVVAIEVPSTALKSEVILTAPTVGTLGVISIYVPSVVVTESTSEVPIPALVPTLPSASTTRTVVAGVESNFSR